MKLFVDEVTEGLQEDPELQLEVAHEITAHLEDSRGRFVLEGHSEDECDRLAQNAFGDAEELADELTAIHQPRIHRRKKIRGFVTRILLTLGIVTGLWSAGSQLSRVRFVPPFARMVQKGYGEKPLMPSAYTLSNEQAFIFFGDTSATNKTLQQRAIWEKYPKNKRYYANYILTLLKYEVPPYGMIPPEHLNHLVNELRRGEQLDPDNSFYNYLLAFVYFRSGLSITFEQIKNKPKGKLILKVVDADLMKTCHQELDKAQTKPYYRRYVKELMRERLGFLPDARLVEEMMFKVDYLLRVNPQDLRCMGEMFIDFPDYAAHLHEQTPWQTLPSWMQSWRHFVKQANPEVFTLVDSGMMMNVIRAAGAGEEKAWKWVVDPLKANEVSVLCRTLRAARFSYRGKSGYPGSAWMMPELYQKKGGELIRMATPFAGISADEKELEPGRMLDYVMIEQAVMTGLITILLIVMLLAGFWLAVTRRFAKPIWLVFSKKWVYLIACVGVLIPMLIYYFLAFGSDQLLTRVSYHGPRYTMLQMIAPLTALSLTTFLLIHFVRHRCTAMGLPTPRPPHRAFTAQFWIALIVLWCFYFGYNHGVLKVMHKNMPCILVGVLIAIFVLVSIGMFITGLVRRKTYPRFYGTFATTMLTGYAMLMILIAGIRLPWLRQHEAILIQRNTILTPDLAPSFSQPEVNYVTHVREELEKAIQKTGL